MGADATERCRRMEVSTREVKAVTGPKQRLDHSRLSCGSLNRSLPIVPRLIAQRRLQDRPMNLPLLLAIDLHYEDIVYVVMSAEALVLRRGYVGIGLPPEAQVRGGRAGGIKEWR